MQPEGFRVTGAHERDHWWFRARRELFLAQVRRAVDELGARAHPLELLDFGCGTGFNLAFLARFGRVTGADRFREQEREFRLEHGFPLVDVERDLSGLEERFDVVTALDVLEHIDDDVAGLRRIAALARPGGQIVLTVPAYAWLWSGEDVISEHRRRYTRRSLLRTCRAADLTPRFTSYFNLSILPGMAAVVWARRLRGGAAATRSNLSTPPDWANRMLYALTSREARWVGAQSLFLPAGASLVCRLEKARA